MAEEDAVVETEVEAPATTGDQGDAGQDTPAQETRDDSDQGGKRPTVRQALDQAVDESRKSAKRRPTQQSRARQEMAGGDADAEPAADAPAQAQQPAVEPPPGWPREAAEQWRTMTPAQQAVVNTRLAQSEQGVRQIRERYGALDQALEPHLEAMRAHNLTPPQAVSQLFAWFQALARNPGVAFPALAKSFNMDLAKIVAAQQAQPEGAAAAQQAQAPQVPDIDARLQPVLTKMSALETAMAAENERRTQEAISGWAANKPHFEDVRVLMGQLLASGAVALKEGRVDLDAAYNMAVNAHDGVRAKIAAEATAAADAKKKADADAKLTAQRNVAQRSRVAGSASVSGSAPSGERAGKQSKRGMTVRESLMKSIEDLSA
jgi:hypothetical protein